MQRPTRPKAVMAALVGVIIAVSSGLGAAEDAGPLKRAPENGWVRPEGEAVDGTTPDLRQTCTAAVTTPLCALKTYLACVLYDAPALCAAVGLEGLPEIYPGPDTLDTEVVTAPWALPFERLMPEAFALHIYDGGLVSGARFPVLPDGKPALSGSAFELIMDIPEPYVKGLVYTLSFFFRAHDTGWHMVAWSSSRAKACDAAFGTETWAPCKRFLKTLQPRNVFAADVTQLWAAPESPGREDYPHPGVEIMAGLPHQPVVAPFAGTIIRRSLKYPDVPLYDWVVIQGENRQTNMIVKYAMVDRTGAPAGTRVAAADILGRPQWVESEHPGAGRSIHMELLRDGQQIDPRSVMRERKVQDAAP